MFFFHHAITLREASSPALGFDDRNTHTHIHTHTQNKHTLYTHINIHTQTHTHTTKEPAATTVMLAVACFVAA